MCALMSAIASNHSVQEHYNAMHLNEIISFNHLIGKWYFPLFSSDSYFVFFILIYIR